MPARRSTQVHFASQKTYARTSELSLPSSAWSELTRSPLLAACRSNASMRRQGLAHVSTGHPQRPECSFQNCILLLSCVLHLQLPAKGKAHLGGASAGAVGSLKALCGTNLTLPRES